MGVSQSIIEKTIKKLTSYTEDMLEVNRICILQCMKWNSSFNLEFFIVNTQNILGLNACEHPVRMVPIPLLDILKISLEELINGKIIEKVEGLSEWVKALVLVKKPNGSLRICLDPKDINKVIKREYCPIPTLEQITSDMAGATIFSTLDATQGSYEIKLDKQSSDLCTFGTPFGRFKFLRLPCGLKPAPEVFQEKFQSIFKSTGAKVYIDDIIIWGKLEVNMNKD